MKKLIFSVSVFAAVLLSFLPLAAQTAISSSGNVTGAAEGVNDVSATLKDTDGRRIVSATASGYRGKTGEVVNDAMAKTGDAQRSVPQYLSYTLILSGEIASDEGGGEFAGEGGPETYSATRLERGAIYIEAEGYETSNITIPSGETAIFRLKNTTGENVFGDWNVSKDGGASQKKDGVKSITFNRSFWGDIISWFTSDGAVPALMPGVYSITATPENRTEPTAAGNLTVVGVDKIEVKIRDGNYKTPDAVTYVAVGDSFSIKAFPMPSGGTWPTGTPVWSTSGDEWFSNRVSGVGEEKSVDTSDVEDEFDIIATCGSSEKRITVTVTGISYIEANYNGNIVRSETDHPSSNESICVDVSSSGNMTITAKQNPNSISAWPEGYPRWTVNGTASVSNSYLLSKKNTGTYNITAECGSSKIKMIVYIVSAQFHVYIEQPIPGCVAPLNSNLDVGHTWWRFLLVPSVASNAKELKNYCSFINTNVGYYPKDAVGSPKFPLFASDYFSGAGKLVLSDNLHSPSPGCSKTYFITLSQLKAGLTFTKNTYDNPGTYILAHRIIIAGSHDTGNMNEKNCTTVAIAAGNSCGVSLPNTLQTWTGAVNIAGVTRNVTFIGHSPGQLGEDIK